MAAVAEVLPVEGPPQVSTLKRQASVERIREVQMMVATALTADGTTTVSTTTRTTTTSDVEPSAGVGGIPLKGEEGRRSSWERLESVRTMAGEMMTSVGIDLDEVEIKSVFPSPAGTTEVALVTPTPSSDESPCKDEDEDGGEDALRVADGPRTVKDVDLEIERDVETRESFEDDYDSEEYDSEEEYDDDEYDDDEFDEEEEEAYEEVKEFVTRFLAPQQSSLDVPVCTDAEHPWSAPLVVCFLVDAFFLVLILVVCLSVGLYLSTVFGQQTAPFDVSKHPNARLVIEESSWKSVNLG